MTGTCEQILPSSEWQGQWHTGIGKINFDFSDTLDLQKSSDPEVLFVRREPFFRVREVFWGFLWVSGSLSGEL